MDDTNDNEVVNAEIVEEDTKQTSTPVEAGQATVLLNLEDMIKNYISSIDKLSEDLKKTRQMFSDTFESNATYKEQEVQAKTANDVKAKTKQEILKQPQVRTNAEKIKDISTELRSKKKELSDYLLEYQRMTNATTIEDHNGELRDIELDAKLSKRSSKK